MPHRPHALTLPRYPALTLPRSHAPLGLAILLLVLSSASAAELKLKVADEEPPKEMDAAIRNKLQSKAVQLLDGEKPAYEFWFSREIPLQTKPASLPKALDAIKETTLLGAVSVPASK